MTGSSVYGLSAYKRLPADGYWSIDPCIGETLVGALERLGVDPAGLTVLEPCAGRGDLMRQLEGSGMRVIGTDRFAHPGRDPRIRAGERFDLFRLRGPVASKVNAVVTNPPFDKSIVDRIVRHLLVQAPVQWIALLLRADWIHGQGRRPILDGGRLHAVALLPKRPYWVPPDPVTGKHKASPRFSYLWLLFRPEAHRHAGMAPVVLFPRRPTPEKSADAIRVGKEDLIVVTP